MKQTNNEKKIIWRNKPAIEEKKKNLEKLHQRSEAIVYTVRDAVVDEMNDGLTCPRRPPWSRL